MTFWNIILSVGLTATLTAAGYQLRVIRENTRRLDNIEGATPVERIASLENKQGSMESRIASIEAQESRLESIEKMIDGLPERIAAIEAQEWRKTSDQLYSRINKVDRTVSRLEGTVSKLDTTVGLMHSWLIERDK